MPWAEGRKLILSKKYIFRRNFIVVIGTDTSRADLQAFSANSQDISNRTIIPPSQKASTYIYSVQQWILYANNGLSPKKEFVTFYTVQNTELL